MPEHSARRKAKATNSEDIFYDRLTRRYITLRTYTDAYRKARQGKRWKGAAAKFEVNLLEALNLLSYAATERSTYTLVAV